MLLIVKFSEITEKKCVNDRYLHSHTRRRRVKLCGHVSNSIVKSTGAALLENNEASAKLTTTNGGTFTR